MALAGNFKSVSGVNGKMNFSDWLQDQILKSGNTRKELAKLAGIPKNQLDSFCNGTLPSKYQVSKLSSALNIDEDEMLGILSDITCGTGMKIEPVKSHFNPDLSHKTAPNQLKSDYKTPLQPIKDKTCVITGKLNPERAHYTGIAQALFGKGLSEKCDNLFVAEICREKHIEFDQPKERKSLQASHDFLVAILLTIKRKAENGQIIFVK